MGTISVEKSEQLSRALNKRGIPHEVLNAKQHAREADIVAQAGRLGAITVATNMAGRGVDVLLGGNPEGLAQRDLRGKSIDPQSDEGKDFYEQRLKHHTESTNQEREKVIELGGLYVLGTERHESRRIDNQLRGRSGRQGDPGRSRFYLSLEDELMRLFATGAMNWVMDKALPEDSPIEANMVSKAIERAQNTVEQRNAETRKNVLKYDEVMNEQRKVIYERRNQILDGSDLRSETLKYIDQLVDGLVDRYCASDLAEEWELESLITELTTLWPTELSASALADVHERSELSERLSAEGASTYELRESELGDEMLRQVERQIMLLVIDQRWRHHLAEMDLLREGIHLRAMGQRDPAIEWQREGFANFTQMMTAISEDFVKYVMHAQKSPAEPSNSLPEPQLAGVTEQKVSSNGNASAASMAALNGVVPQKQDDVRTPIVKTDLEKVGRNQPCPCGSGKKFKMCHGRSKVSGSL